MKYFERLVGTRYLFSQKRNNLIGFTTFISVGGVAIGVAALIVVMSVMNGFGSDLKRKILGFKSHILVAGLDYRPFAHDPALLPHMKQVAPSITEVTPFVMSEMIIRFQGNVTGVLYKGVPKRLMKESFVDASSQPGIYLGQELAYILDVIAGDEIEIISPIERTGPFGSLPKMKRYKVSGFITTGVYEYDTKLAYVQLSEAQQFLDYENKIDGYEIKVQKPIAYAAALGQLKTIPAIEKLNVRGWPELNHVLFSALKLEKLAMFVILSFIILVAASNIITTITRTVLEKKREIAILKTMGAESKQVLLIFLFQGVCIGLVGIVCGILGGFLICFGLNSLQLIQLPDIYYSTSVPVEMEMIYFVLTAAVAFLITLVSSLYPAWKASQFEPLEGLK